MILFNAKIILQISTIEFFKQILGKLENISIKLKLDNQVAETSVVAFESKLFYKESFELDVSNRILEDSYDEEEYLHRKKLEETVYTAFQSSRWYPLSYKKKIPKDLYWLSCF